MDPFGRKRRREEHARLLERVAELELDRDTAIRAIAELQARPLLPVEDVRELRGAVAGKVQRAIETHHHPTGGVGEPIKPAKIRGVG